MANVGEEVYGYQVIDIFVENKVYKVTLEKDLSKKKFAVLKDLSNNYQEVENTTGFSSKDENGYFVDIKEFEKHYLLLKYYKNGTLYDYLNKNCNLDSNKRYDFINNILNIGCCLHDDSCLHTDNKPKRFYLHTDIKPNNFFIDDDLTIKLGDLESIIEVEDIYNHTIVKTCGTKGFKYSLGRSYDLKDEMFAYIATIYYILTNELLVTEDNIDKDINKDQSDLIEEFNRFAKSKIDKNSKLTDDEKEFLKSNLDSIKDEKEFDCCDLATNWDEFNKPDSPPYPPEDKKTLIEFLLSNIKVIAVSLFIIISIVIAITLFRGNEVLSHPIPDNNTTYENNSSEDNSTHENNSSEDNNTTELNYSTIIIPKPKFNFTQYQQRVVDTLKKIEMQNSDYNFGFSKQKENNITFRIYSNIKGFLSFIIIEPDNNISIKSNLEIAPKTEYYKNLLLNSNKRGKYLIYLVYTTNRVNFKPKSQYRFKLNQLKENGQLKYLRHFKVDL